MEVKSISSYSTLEDSDSDCRSNSIKKKIIVIFACMNALLCYDTGVIPASLAEIQEELSLNYSETAFIGSSVYIGLCSATFVVFLVFHKFTASKVLLVSMILNSFFCFLFAISKNLLIIYFSRIAMGFTQAFCVVYAPIWINHFSPEGKSASWIGFLQISSPIGIVFGYSLASVFYIISKSLSWRIAVLLQGLLELPFIISFCSVKNEDVDVLLDERNKKTASCEVSHEDIVNPLSTLGGFRIVLKNWVFLLTVLALSNLFFVVSGVQYWVSLYMVKCLNGSPGVVITGFVLCSTTGPIFGVLAGSFVSDSYGGYKGDNILKAMKICLIFASVSLIFAFFSCFAQDVYLEFTLLWVMFFFGAGVVPAATGITIDLIDKKHQNLSSSFSQLLYNFIGFFMAPILSGALMDSFGSNAEGLRLGFQFILSYSCVAVLLLSLAFYLAYKKNSKLVIIKT